MNIENAVVIVDETQNLSRNEVRALLTRMGEGVKCFCLGDTSQVDNPYLSESNNGLNWIVRKFKGFSNYAHIVLKGDRSRGPITDLVLKSKL
jgi:PhoH-like ATPase